MKSETRRLRKRWVEAGRPRGRENPTFAEYKESKRKFRRTLRNKSLEHEIKENDELHGIFELNRSKFHKIISKKRKAGMQVSNALKVSDRMVHDDNEILNVWRDHYLSLYNQTENNDYDESFRKEIKSKIVEYHNNSFEWLDDPLKNEITVEEVAELCLQLPNGKAGGPDGVVYEHLKYAGKEAYVRLAHIFDAVRELETVPDTNRKGIIISLFKGKKKSKYNKDNYRGIALLNVAGKLFERLLLNPCMPFFQDNGLPNSLKFAYQKSKNSLLASFVLQEAIFDSVENSSKVYACFLDSAKAFDTVWIDGLFFKLYNMGIRGKTWRMLRNWYNKMSCRVAANNLVSAPFTVRQGVKPLFHFLQNQLATSLRVFASN